MANQLDNGFDPCYPFTRCPIVYEFHRCLWHRCPCCFPLHHDRFPICHNDRALQELYKSTLKKQETLRQQGYDVKMQWECAWDQEVKTKLDLQQFLDTLEIVDLLQSRDTFFGRCTNAVKLPHATDVCQGEKVYKGVQRRDVAILLGQQEGQIPRRTLKSPRQSRRSRQPSLLRDSQSGHSTSSQTIPSSPAP